MNDTLDVNNSNMNEPPMCDNNVEDEQNFSDDEFDAGVDANSDVDPKKYIQQLSGKLSQELRSYNQEQETPDTDLNKYVAGMVIPQATKSMTDDDKKEVIKKIQKGITDDEEYVDSNDTDDSEPNNEYDGSDSENQIPMESKNYLNSIINEIIGSVINKEKNSRDNKEIRNKKIKKTNPFISNR